jgi:uncharacterized protein YcgI (DUF1989 family)
LHFTEVLDHAAQVADRDLLDPTDDCSANWMWSPEDSLLLGTLDGAGTAQFLADPTTGKVHEAPWTASGHPAWQPLAR